MEQDTENQGRLSREEEEEIMRQIELESENRSCKKEDSENLDLIDLESVMQSRVDSQDLIDAIECNASSVAKL